MDLFNNPAVNNALKALTPEQIEEYKRIGEAMHGHVNFTDSSIIKQMEPPLEESVAYIEEGIRSGLLPSDLSEDEVTSLCKAYGDKWYERYGFKQHEVPEPGLSLDMKNALEKAVETKIKNDKLRNSKNKKGNKKKQRKNRKS